MGYRLTLIAAIFLVFAGSLLAQKQIDTPAQPEYTPRWSCRHIVSTAPSITETLYALGLGSRVVGVTRNCNYPPQVAEVKKTGNVGGYYDPNLEAILALKPDLVIMLEEQARAIPNFDALKLETLVVSHQTVDGIIDSFREIGVRCGAGERGRQMARHFRRRIENIRRHTEGLPRPRVLFVLDRTFGRGQLADLYVAADDAYFDTIIDWAGGQNAYRRPGVRYPVVSTEGVIKLNPDVIVDLVPRSMIEQYGQKKVLDDWKSLTNVEAVKRGRVFIFDQDYAYVPGPRFLRLVEDLARLLHPEVEWNGVEWNGVEGNGADHFAPPDDSLNFHNNFPNNFPTTR